MREFSRELWSVAVLQRRSRCLWVIILKRIFRARWSRSDAGLEADGLLGSAGRSAENRSGSAKSFPLIG